MSIIPKGRACLGRNRDQAPVLCTSSTKVFPTDIQACWSAMRRLRAPLHHGGIRNLWFHCSILPTKGPLHNCIGLQGLSERVNYLSKIKLTCSILAITTKIKTNKKQALGERTALVPTPAV